MAILPTVVVAAAIGFGWLTGAEAVPAADAGALYTALGSVAVALIGGTFAYAVANRQQHDPKFVITDEPTTHALPLALVELHEDERDRLIAERDRMANERDMWMQRAYEAGWRDPE